MTVLAMRYMLVLALALLRLQVMLLLLQRLLMANVVLVAYVGWERSG